MTSLSFIDKINDLYTISCILYSSILAVLICDKGYK
jgi:hypothetical protein